MHRAVFSTILSVALLSCVSGGGPPIGGADNRVCDQNEHYSQSPDDCLATPAAEESRAGATGPRADGDPPWSAWEGLCLVGDRQAAGNGVCELQESRMFRSDCEPSCGDGKLTGDEATTCMLDWLADRRGCQATDPVLCADPGGKCPNNCCEPDEDACTCPEDCGVPARYRARRVGEDGCEMDDGSACPPLPDLCETSETTSTSTTPTTGSTTETTTEMTTETTTESTTEPSGCDEDPACGPGEDVNNCPEQCNTCGDGVVYGDELCDEGAKNQTWWPGTPSNGACSEDCNDVFQWCGDNLTNGPELCDTGPMNQTYWPSAPSNMACSENCDKMFEWCGDGVKNGVEACDDSNAEDFTGCTDMCTTECIVFATATAYLGDFGGMLPDELCQSAADDAKLYGSYKAWLSYTGEPAKTRLVACETQVRRRNGDVVADDWMKFMSSTHGNEINLDAGGSPLNLNIAAGAVWTGTAVDGSVDEDNCNDWMFADDMFDGLIGNVSAKGFQWTAAASSPCGAMYIAHLYCVQQPAR